MSLESNNQKNTKTHLNDLIQIGRRYVEDWDEITPTDPLMILGEFIASASGRIQDRIDQLPSHIAKQLPAIFGFRASFASPSIGYAKIKLEDQAEDILEFKASTPLQARSSEQKQSVYLNSYETINLLKKDQVSLNVSQSEVILGLETLPFGKRLSLFFEIDAPSETKILKWNLEPALESTSLVVSDETNGFKNTGYIHFSLDQVNDAQKNEHGLYLLRAKIQSDQTPGIRQVLSNVIALKNEHVVEKQCIGSGNGLPNQRLKLPSGQPTESFSLLVQSHQSKDLNQWIEVESFFLSEPGSEHFRYLAQSEEVMFGDGTYGKSVSPGYDNVWVQNLRLTQGSSGNLSKRAKVELKKEDWRIKSIELVTSIHGGVDASGHSQQLEKLHTCLKNRDRLITLDDFANAPLIASNRIAKAFITKKDHYTYELFPILKPQYAKKPKLLDLSPSDNDLSMIQDFINERKPLNSKIVVSAPNYKNIEIQGTIFLESTEPQFVSSVETMILNFFSPIESKVSPSSALSFDLFNQHLDQIPMILRTHSISMIDDTLGKKTSKVLFKSNELPRVRLNLRYEEVRS